MYEDYYQLRAKPFQVSPDARFFFSSKGHRRAMAYLVYGAHQGDGFIVITGDIGTGKTTLAHVLARNLESEDVVLARIMSTQLGADEIVRMVAAAFGLPDESSKAVMLSKLEQFLLARSLEGKRALLLIDEAQNLPLAAVEELRMLSNFQSEEKPLLQSFLLGQPEFRKTLQSPGMEQLRQRIIASCHLGPMDEAETEAYIVHRLQTVGWTGDPSFGPGVFAEIHGYTGGIPRKINVLCDRLLLSGYLEETHEFSAAQVRAVIDELRQEFAPVNVKPTKRGKADAG